MDQRVHGVHKHPHKCHWTKSRPAVLVFSGLIQYSYIYCIMTVRSQFIYRKIWPFNHVNCVPCRSLGSRQIWRHMFMVSKVLYFVVFSEWVSNDYLPKLQQPVGACRRRLERWWALQAAQQPVDGNFKTIWWFGKQRTHRATTSTTPKWAPLSHSLSACVICPTSFLFIFVANSLGHSCRTYICVFMRNSVEISYPDSAAGLYIRTRANRVIKVSSCESHYLPCKI